MFKEGGGGGIRNMGGIKRPCLIGLIKKLDMQKTFKIVFWNMTFWIFN